MKRSGGSSRSGGELAADREDLAAVRERLHVAAHARASPSGRALARPRPIIFGPAMP
jgi:hypothetical protein